MDWRKTLVCLFVSLVGIFLLHWRLLLLPYFWDEAGYYIPAARDFFLHHQLIPSSTLTNAHPPLPSLYLASAWWLFGCKPVVTRIAMLVIASLGLTGVFVLSRRLQNETVAWVTVACTALYPIWFAQSTLAHADLLACCFCLWGLGAYYSRRMGWAAALFSCAALSKEIAILFPLALAVLEFAASTSSRLRALARYEGSTRRHVLFLLSPVLPLATWFAYHYRRTGYVFGNPEFVQYNIAGTHSPARVLMAFLHRGWHLFGHMNLFVLVTLGVVAMYWPAIPGRERIRIPDQLVIAYLIVVNWMAFSIVGGALLTRYLLPCYPLIILISVSTLWRRWRMWPVAIALVLASFLVALVHGPKYRFSPEDNLAYADYIRLHESAAQYIEQHLPKAIVLTAWTGTDELSKPWLGYVETPVRVVSIDDFSLQQVTLAAQDSGAFDAALVFSTKYDPGPGLLTKLPGWERRNEQYFGFHEDLPPEAIATLLQGKIAWQQRRGPMWAAVIVFPRAMVG